MVLLKETAVTAEKVVDTEECPQLVEMQDAGKVKVDEEYFTSYDSVEVHRLMIRDKARTDTYKNAILQNPQYFKLLEYLIDT